MRNELDRELELRLERRLRNAAPVLSRDFRRNVMEQIALLPPPAALAPPTPLSGWRQLLQLLGTGEKVGLALIMTALLLPFLPGSGAWLAALEFSLSTAEVSLSLGSLVLSASLLTVVAAALGLGLLVLCGAYSTRHRLLGA